MRRERLQTSLSTSRGAAHLFEHREGEDEGDELEDRDCAEREQVGKAPEQINAAECGREAFGWMAESAGDEAA